MILPPQKKKRRKKKNPVTPLGGKHVKVKKRQRQDILRFRANARNWF